MPLFEYLCRKCGKGFEHLSLNSRDLPYRCPACGAKNPEKQLSSFQARTGSSGEPSCVSSGSCKPRGCCASGSCPHGRS